MNGFESLQRSIERLVGIQCSNYKEDYIKRRILSRMRLTNTADFEDYHRYLLANRQEIEGLRNALTINVTKFFRDTGVFDTLKREIIPGLVRRRRPVRIWCAGCATGEEPYSVAILMREQLGMNDGGSVTIYATDIDRDSLKKAKEGVYDENALENVGERRIRRYFVRRDDGTYAIRPIVSDMVTFKQHDLMTGIPISRYLDLIICRNVTIYFTEKQKNDLVRMFHAALVQGGYYVMGKTEYLGREVEDLFISHSATQKILVKRG
ncbi:chemotaxis protein methyltransferase cher [hydrocarbon metagenome]|uniref:protein-glutamate O-methyltransferase n=1 Tax=hydrocarbon metagenome TaxID=938273 RepID=A0A0W8FGV8_9ZZZZ|nr:protein-glutamate O-methyltransferase CheR [Methanomicrobiaceae archaeon]